MTKHEDHLMLSIPKSFMNERFVIRFMERLRFFQLIQKSELTEEQAWELSEEIKSNWWENNKNRLLHQVQEV